ncbi:MAG: divalent metal cation transporter, partial [Nitrosopumilus sp.]
KPNSFYIFFLLVLGIGSLAVVFQFRSNLKELVDFATVLSFVIAPIIAIFNYRLVTGKFLDSASHPSRYLKALSLAGIAFLIAFASLFIITRFF